MGRINDLAEAFRELQFERVGEVKHKRTGRKPTLWLRDSFDFFCDKSMSSICNLYWMPMNIEEWNLSKVMLDYSKYYEGPGDLSRLH